MTPTLSPAAVPLLCPAPGCGALLQDCSHPLPLAALRALLTAEDPAVLRQALDLALTLDCLPDALAMRTWTAHDLAALAGPQEAVAFAAACARRVLPVWEARYPEDDRPRKAIEAAEGWLRGEVSEEDLSSARKLSFGALDDELRRERPYVEANAAESAAYSTGGYLGSPGSTAHRAAYWARKASPEEAVERDAQQADLRARLAAHLSPPSAARGEGGGDE